MNEAEEAAKAAKRAQIRKRLQELNTIMYRCKSEELIYNDRKRMADRSREALCQFETSVKSIQNGFKIGNSAKSAALERVLQFAPNNAAAKNYYNGMKEVLSRSGGKVLRILFGFLLYKISDEKRSLDDEIMKNVNKRAQCLRTYENAQLEYQAKMRELQSI